MNIDPDGFKFDVETQRFMLNRWETELGSHVRAKLIDSIKLSGDIRGILDGHILEDNENSDPHGHPMHPKHAMGVDEFWVLSSDDLRGIRFFEEDFSHTKSLAKKSLGYSFFNGCNLSHANLERTDSTCAQYIDCEMRGIVLAVSRGFNVTITVLDLSTEDKLQKNKSVPHFLSGSPRKNRPLANFLRRFPELGTLFTKLNIGDRPRLNILPRTDQNENVVCPKYSGLALKAVGRIANNCVCLELNGFDHLSEHGRHDPPIQAAVNKALLDLEIG